MRALTDLQTLLMILAIAAGAMITRFLPFWLFPQKRRVPRVVLYLGGVLPPAMMGLLAVYCLKGTSFSAPTYALPEVFALATLYLVHKWKHNTLLSIAGGTLLYMVLIRTLGG